MYCLDVPNSSTARIVLMAAKEQELCTSTGDAISYIQLEMSEMRSHLLVHNSVYGDLSLYHKEFPRKWRELFAENRTHVTTFFEDAIL